MAEVSAQPKWKYITVTDPKLVTDLRVKPATVTKLVPRKRTKGTGSS